MYHCTRPPPELHILCVSSRQANAQPHIVPITADAQAHDDRYHVGPLHVDPDIGYSPRDVCLVGWVAGDGGQIMVLDAVARTGSPRVI
jgi:hypothetical protein